MRIQHNIAAMNAYRNYNTNTSALRKNLEKLSSGYRINRAGDDAAGLAISEKMRAQITGLDAAQKNVKDGVSLVKTAEGAMQEIHDMLGRMKYLATQSANGTYDNPVDRANIQKEVESLKSEINRIADSANFNGQKLLNGELDQDTILTNQGSFTGKLPTVGDVLGTNTVLEADNGDVKETEFSIDLHNFSFSNKNTEKLTIQIGNDKFTLDAGDGGVAAGTAMNASQIITALTDGSFKDANGKALDAGKAVIGGQEFTVTAGADGRVNFKQSAKPTDASEFVKGDMTVTITGAGTTATTITANPANSNITVTDGQDGVKNATVEFSFQGATFSGNGDVDVTIGGTTVTVRATDGMTAKEFADAFVLKYNAAKVSDADAGEFTATADTNGKITLTSANQKVMADANLFGANGTAFTMTPKAPGAASGSGDYNVSTTVISQGAVPGEDRLASTHFQLKKEMITEGGNIRIGDQTYTFVAKGSGAGGAAAAGEVVIGDLKADAADYLEKVAIRLTDAAKDNTTYTVGHDGSRMTFTEKQTYKDLDDDKKKYDLSTRKGIEDSFGWSGPTKTGTGLNLQIGDTSDDYNQLTVSVKDMHTKALGIDDLDLGTQQGAHEAIDQIMNAINTVSSTRGDLGAIQNRLEHTEKNLSVMQENIQEAESAIRDTDVAAEMMAYTKNNILVQSAQAMLAQANQMPQGVLQLLQ